MVRLRFAPSPTGYLHIGGARTALFNWLYARNQKGAFILRIEDTDEVRSTKESMGAVLESLQWLGLDWDEGPVPGDMEGARGTYGPYYQMKRQELYRSHVEKLIQEGKAYPCFCTPEDLDQIRRQRASERTSGASGFSGSAPRAGASAVPGPRPGAGASAPSFGSDKGRRASGVPDGPPKYDGRCRSLPPDEVKRRKERGNPWVARFKMLSEGETSWEDLVYGKVSFENKLLDDFIILKSSGVPIYNFACVIDDKHMDITHVIRGEDHISNTPRQIRLFEAFGWKPPAYGHLSMIRGPDGGRLSKRHGASSVLEYRDNGFLPEALRNYLALLGWATTDSQQIFAPDELIEKFDLKGCQKSPAIFDPRKLEWMNGEYIRNLPPGELLEKAWPFLEKAGLSERAAREDLSRAVSLEQEKYKTLRDVPGRVDFFFQEVRYDPAVVDKVLKCGGVAEILSGLAEVLEDAEPFSEKALEEKIRGFCKERGYKTSRVFHPVRVAVSGRTQGPGLFSMLEALGKEKVLERVKKALELI